ncbi:MAG TPA: hypothetical protein VHI78_08905, partial [Bacteroidales bacterium]|nr:hypothetical protein [Bacteroidales bacterium]
FDVNNKRYFYIVEPEKKYPSMAMLTKRGRIKTAVNFYGNNCSGLDSVKLSHKNIDLSIRLYRIYE